MAAKKKTSAPKKNSLKPGTLTRKNVLNLAQKVGLQTKTKQVYFAELKLGDQLYHAGADTAIDAFNALVAEVPQEVQRNPKTKGVLSITKDGQTKQRFFYPAGLQRFFRNPLNRSIHAKVLSL